MFYKEEAVAESSEGSVEPARPPSPVDLRNVGGGGLSNLCIGGTGLKIS
jgi:hypothetical protein